MVEPFLWLVNVKISINRCNVSSQVICLETLKKMSSFLALKEGRKKLMKTSYHLTWPCFFYFDQPRHNSKQTCCVQLTDGNRRFCSLTLVLSFPTFSHLLYQHSYAFLHFFALFFSSSPPPPPTHTKTSRPAESYIFDPFPGIVTISFPFQWWYFSLS